MSGRPLVLVFVVLVVAGATGCVPERDAGASATPTVSPTMTATSTPSDTASPSPTPQPSATSETSPVDCWTIALPDAVITSTQTPEEFESENPGLVASGAAIPCSLFADGSLVVAGDAWIDVLVTQGWTDRGSVEDEVYVSRSAAAPDGLVAAFLATAPGSAAPPVTQFMTYRE